MRASTLVALLVGLLAAHTAFAATNSADVDAIKGLQKCVAANAKNLNGVMGWNTTASASPQATAAMNALIAAGTPGVGSSDPCSTPNWSGLICQGDRIEQVIMSQLGPNGLAGCDLGSLSDLSGLSAATQVDLSGEGLTGTLPESWADGFEALQILSLAHNSIDGSLPDSWSQGFKSLQNLDFEGNQVGGEIPLSWGVDSAFPELLTMQLTSNSLEGGLPPWTGLPSIQLLGFARNNLSGVLPDQWVFPQLSQLQVEYNSFEGCLPGTYSANLPNLTRLTVAGNNLEGTIPASYATPELTIIQITPGNQFSGTISLQLATYTDPNGNVNNRFDPQPTTKNAQGGYTLAAADPGLVCPAYSAAQWATSPAAAPAQAPSATPVSSTADRKLLGLN